MEKVTKDTRIGDLIGLHEDIPDILLSIGMHCLGCPASQVETLEEACAVHGVAVDDIVDKINNLLKA